MRIADSPPQAVHAHRPPGSAAQQRPRLHCRVAEQSFAPKGWGAMFYGKVAGGQLLITRPMATRRRCHFAEPRCSCGRGAFATTLPPHRARHSTAARDTKREKPPRGHPHLRPSGGVPAWEVHSRSSAAPRKARCRTRCRRRPARPASFLYERAAAAAYRWSFLGTRTRPKRTGCALPSPSRMVAKAVTTALTQRALLLYVPRLPADEAACPVSY